MAALTDDTQYSVVVEASGGTVGVIALLMSFQGAMARWLRKDPCAAPWVREDGSPILG